MCNYSLCFGYVFLPLIFLNMYIICTYQAHSLKLLHYSLIHGISHDFIAVINVFLILIILDCVILLCVGKNIIWKYWSLFRTSIMFVYITILLTTLKQTLSLYYNEIPTVPIILCINIIYNLLFPLFY